MGIPIPLLVTKSKQFRAINNLSRLPTIWNFHQERWVNFYVVFELYLSLLITALAVLNEGNFTIETTLDQGLFSEVLLKVKLLLTKFLLTFYIRIGFLSLSDTIIDFLYFFKIWLLGLHILSKRHLADRVNSTLQHLCSGKFRRITLRLFWNMKSFFGHP